MSSNNNVSVSEMVARDFAAQFPTPNVLRGIALCEAGRISWDDFALLCERSLRDAMAS